MSARPLRSARSGKSKNDSARASDGSIQKVSSTVSTDARIVQFSVETITPESAAKFLENVREGAVKDEKAIQAYAQAMRSETWLVNGMPIILGRNGEVLDGIQRLHASMEAATPFKTFIAHNVRADTLHTVDQHRRRSYKAVLDARGEAHSGGLIRLMSKLIRIENGILGMHKLAISWSRLDRVLDSNPLLRDAIKMSTDARNAKLHATARHVVVFMGLAAGHVEAVAEFLGSIRSWNSFPMDHPGRMLALQLDIGSADDEVDEKVALAILAFNDIVAGKRIGEPYKWKPNFGKAGPDATRAKMRQLAPANLDLPTLTGYPGLKNALFETATKTDTLGPLSEALRHSVKASNDADFSIEIITITPERAKEWLDKHNIGNRRILPNHVRMIARDISSERWMFNAQPICFSTEGRLLNGQHRLLACVEADQPIDVAVARGIPDQAFATYDIHAKKTVPSGMSIESADMRVIAAAAKIQWRLDEGVSISDTRNKPTSSELADTIRRHKDLSIGFPLARRMMNIGSAAVMTFLIYHVRQSRRPYAEDFLHQLETGEGLVRGNPVLKVRNALLTNRGSDVRADRLATLISCWDDYVTWSDDQESRRQKEKRDPGRRRADASGIAAHLEAIDRDDSSSPAGKQENAGPEALRKVESEAEIAKQGSFLERLGLKSRH